MKILVTGAKGQLGNELKELALKYPDYRFLFTDVEELDITDAKTVNAFVAADQPEVIINCAAYTAVDKAETDEESAFRVNATAPANLAKAAKKHNILLVHISTDYVFDGKVYLPLKETAPTQPVSVYAKSKFAGEQEVLKHASRALVIRTSWLYSAFGNNFVKTIMKYGAERGKLNVVFDQTGTPTYAHDLAKMILEILPAAKEIKGVQIFHYSNEGVASWYDFAKAIIELSGINCIVNSIESKDYPRPAVPPFYSVLDKQKIKETFGIEIPYWRDSLKDCIRRLGAG
ncbi:MAG: dTDP-4-dehydrorhamnose reductase [Bacteroidetes bacterium]|nr:dTDP-4-dehydrorhamnose reductase [Bacteroidota bacterium]